LTQIAPKGSAALAGDTNKKSIATSGITFQKSINPWLGASANITIVPEITEHNRLLIFSIYLIA